MTDMTSSHTLGSVGSLTLMNTGSCG